MTPHCAVLFLAAFFGSTFVWSDAPSQSSGTKGAPVARDAPEKILFELRVGRDPLLSPLEKAKKEPRSALKKAAGTMEKEPAGENLIQRLVIQGITRFEDRPAVIINDEIKKIGDEIAGARILAISNDAVIFKYKGRIFKRFLGKKKGFGKGE